MDLLTVYTFICTLLCYVEYGSASADSFGREFIFSYLTPFSSDSRGIPYLLIASQSSLSVTNVNVTFPTGATSTQRSLVVTPQQLLNVTLGLSVYPPTRLAARYNKSVVIRADHDVSVHGMYGFVHVGSAAQASGFLVMPTTMLGKEHVIVTYPPHVNHLAEFAVTALHDRARVRIRVKAGDDVDLTLQPYESYQIRGRLDLTGSIVIADKPVSVMSGASCVQVPVNSRNCEHIATHTPDVSSYGILHVLGPFLYRTSGYIYRIITSQMDTSVRIESPQDPTINSILNAGEFYEGSSNTIIAITSDKPVMVAQFAKSRQTDAKGDPFMYIVSPTSLLPSSVSFPVTVLPTKHRQQSYISVTIPCDNSEGLLLDADSPTWDNTLSVDDPSYCIHRKSAVEPGLHNVTHISNDVSFSVLVYGFGLFSSYGYVAARNGHVSRQNWQSNDGVAENTDSGISLHCGVTSMIVRLIPSFVLDGRPSDVHLLDPLCFARLSGSYLEIETNYESCGSLMEESSTGSIFRNRLLYQPPSTNVLRDSALDVPLVCNVGSSAVLSVGAMVPEVGRVDTVVESSEDFGVNLTFTFRMFEDKTFTKAYVAEDYPLNVDVKQPLFFEASVVSSSPESKLTLSVRDIVASASLDINEQPKYYFVNNGCKQDVTVRYYEDKQEDVRRFSLSAVGFSGNFSKVYMHCRVFVCNASDNDNCKEECFLSRSRRSETSGRGFSEHKLTQGPLILVDSLRNEHEGSDWTHVGIPMMTLAAGIAIGCSTMLLWTVFKSRRRRQMLNLPESLELDDFENSYSSLDFILDSEG